MQWSFDFRKLRLMGFVGAVALMTLLLASPTHANDSLSVDLYDLSGRMAGTATMTQMGDMIEVAVMVAGMEPVAGDHLTVITEKGMCGGDFSAAGGIDMTLPNVQFYRDGSADAKGMVEGDLASLSDSDGSAVVLYADMSNESARILCGVAAAPGSMPAPVPPTVQPTPEPAPPPMDPAPEPDPAEPAPAPAEPAPGEPRTLVEYLSDGAGVFLYDVQGRIVGSSWIFSDDDGWTDLFVSVSDMDPVPGDHVMAFTETGQCETPDFLSAGDVVALVPQPMQFYASGSGDFSEGYFDPDFNVKDLLDEDGTAFVIYADTFNDPGPRIICGTLIPFPDYIETFGITVEQFAELLLSE